MALLAATPIGSTRAEAAVQILKGELPSPLNPPPGCAFQSRSTFRNRATGKG
jgi:ABC-type dipeptide/oligopeptide/nickel transport system ATPase component